MKSFIENNIKFIIVIVICLIGSSITTLATNYIFSSNEVSYDNTESGLHADSVQGAIDEVFQHSTDYSGINTRLTNTENTIGSGSLTTTSNTLIGGVNELNGNLGSPSSASGVSGNDAFSKIATLNSNIALKFDASNIKEVSLNTSGKSTGSAYTVNLPSGCTYSNTRVLYTNYYYPGNATFADAQLANDDNVRVLVSLTTTNKVSITLRGSLTNHGTIYVGLLKVS